MAKVLVTWVGKTDLRAADGDASIGEGPVAQAAKWEAFERIVLLCNYARKEGEVYRKWLSAKTTAKLELRVETLRSPTDFVDIHRAVSSALDQIGKAEELTFHLSPGTPAMATIWNLLAPMHRARLLQSSREDGVEVATLPFEIAAEFVPSLVRQGDAQLERLAETARPEDASFDDILGRSEPMRRLIHRAKQAAPYAASILIEGESGTGKELLAQAIHRASTRKGGFVPVNCGALPRDLVESAFFGHAKGAFTGATTDQAGLFEQAHGGTLFLDEIGELPLEAQVKLLRALQEKRFRRVGAQTERSVDVRVIAATNRDLLAEVAAGRFREDLYYRLGVLLLKTPPLRERKGDLGMLIDRQLLALNQESPGAQKKLSPGAKGLLLGHGWPGNVRELHATLMRAFVWSPGTAIEKATVEEALVGAGRPTGDLLAHPLGEGFKLADLLAQVTRHYLVRALEESKGNKTKAASLIGLENYQTLSNWARKHGVKG